MRNVSMHKLLPGSLIAIIATLATTGCGETAAEEASRGQLVAVNGTELFVRRIGSGDPIVIVHGGPMLEHGYLLPHLLPLSHGNELIFYDQRLCGRSSANVDPSKVRIATYVKDLEALRRTLGLGRIHVLGHSFGGLLAMHYALAYPKQLRSLILLDSVAASSQLWQEEDKAAAALLNEENKRQREELRQSEAFARHDPKAIAEMLRLSFATQFHDPANVSKLRLYVPDDYNARSKLFANMRVDLTDFDLHRRLRGINAPTLLLYGDAEPGAEIGGKALAPCFTVRRFVLIKNAGHFPFVEQPEDCLFQIDDFLGAAR